MKVSGGSRFLRTMPSAALILALLFPVSALTSAVVPMTLEVSSPRVHYSVGENVAIDVHFFDIDGSPNRLSIQFGDGAGLDEFRICLAPFPQETRRRFRHPYLQPGSYVVAVTVVSDSCYPLLQETSTRTIQVEVSA